MNQPAHPGLASDTEPTLGAVVRQLATRWSDTQAVVVCAAGLMGAAAVGLLAPAWWRAALPLVALASFGGWIIAERSTRRDGLMRALQFVVGAVGVIAVFAFGLSLLTRVLGIWIS